LRDTSQQVLTEVRKVPRTLALVLLALLVLMGYVFAPTVGQLIRVWTSDPQYSHGYIVPLFALVLLWARRDYLKGWRRGGSWWGVAFFLLSGLFSIAGAYLAVDWLEAAALLPALAGLAVLLGGWPALAWSWPAIGFLLFMIPLPDRVAFALSGPMRNVATVLSTWTMQTLGLPALSEGNIIILGDNTVAVAEACSGLSMLFVFLAISAAVAMLCQRPLLDRLLVLFSAFPIAILANVMRITATGAAYEYLGREAGDLIFHDLAGWLMMPLALVMVWLLLKLIDLLLVQPPARTGLAPAGLPGQSAAAAQQGRKGKERSRRNAPPSIPGLKS
jgi:exosortase